MFDHKKIMNSLKLLEPIPTPVPSLFPADPQVPEGCTVVDGLSDDWGCQVDIHMDIVYAERQPEDWYTDPVPCTLKMHILEPKAHEMATEREKIKFDKLPCVVYIQGSAYHRQWLWYHTSRHIRLAEHGYVVAIVEYRPSEIAPFPSQIQDVKTAIRFLKKHCQEYHIDPDHMAVAGDSSGGHAALMAGFTGDDAPDTELYGEYSAKVNCIIDLYGPTVFSLMNYHNSSLNHYEPDSPEGYEIGRKNVLDNLDLVDSTIPMNYLSRDKETPPLLLIHGGRDMLVPFSQSCYLYNYMKELGKEVDFYKIKDVNHGFDGFNNDTILEIVLDFLKKHI